MRRGAVALAVAVSITCMAHTVAAADDGATARGGRSSTDVELAQRGWVWPVAPFRLERGYQAPAHRYGAGHRGIDLRPLMGLDVRAPAAGVVAFSGSVAGRGILTIDHGDGLVTTVEPVESALEVGAAVERGDLVGQVALGGHTAAGRLALRSAPARRVRESPASARRPAARRAAPVLLRLCGEQPRGAYYARGCASR